MKLGRCSLVAGLAGVLGMTGGAAPAGSGRVPGLQGQPAQDTVHIPPSLVDESWVEPRRNAQLRTTGDFDVFHEFQFTDRVAESGITFAHRIVSDAGRDYKAVHYDHGNGVAAADVDGDGLDDLYLVTQVGANELWRNLGGGRFENVNRGGGGRRRRQDWRRRLVRGHRQRRRPRPLRHHRPRRQRALRERRRRHVPGHLGRVGARPRGPLVGRGVLRLRPRRAARPVSDQRGPLHHGRDRGRRLPLLRRVRGGRVLRASVSGTDRAEPAVPERGREPVRGRFRGDRSRGRAVVGRRQPPRRERRRLDRPVRAEHAGRRRVLRERRGDPLRGAGPRGVSPDLVGRHGDCGPRLQQRRPPGHLHHRHALRHESGGRTGRREAEGGHDLGPLDRGRRDHEHLGQRLLPEPRVRPVPGGVGRGRGRELLALGAQRRRPQRRRLRGPVRGVEHELPLPLRRQLGAAEQRRHALSSTSSSSSGSSRVRGG